MRACVSAWYLAKAARVSGLGSWAAAIAGSKPSAAASSAENVEREMVGSTREVSWISFLVGDRKYNFFSSGSASTDPETRNPGTDGFDEVVRGEVREKGAGAFHFGTGVTWYPPTPTHFSEELVNEGLIFSRVKKSVEVVENKWEILLLVLQVSRKCEVAENAGVRRSGKRAGE